MHVLTFDIYQRGQMKRSYDHTNSFLLKKKGSFAYLVWPLFA